ncbi:MAG: ferredoxin [Candidatus Jettenia sp.]|nr:ferredoxin [Candidatus Jettenia sp.]
MGTNIIRFEGNCIKCVMCIEEAKKVFDYSEETGPSVKHGVDIAFHDEDVKKAVLVCPTQRIKYHP